MTCVNLSDLDRRLVHAIADRRPTVAELEEALGLPAMEAVDRLTRWGWVFGGDRPELSGAGWYHTGAVRGGILNGAARPTGN